MAHAWIQNKTGWTLQPLGNGSFRLVPEGATTEALLLRASARDADAAWLLVTGARGARVNGAPVALGVRALRDRDEIQLPGAAPAFFSTEKLVAVEPYAGQAGGKCPRCTREIEPGTPSVRCGSCGSAYHQSEHKACFTYGENPICVVCACDAVINTDYSWVPEDV